MIFKQYQVHQDGGFHLFGNTSLVRGNFDYFAEADSFLKDIGEEFFPTIKIQEFDRVSDDYKECLLKMFFMKQLKFFIIRGWVVKVFDLDHKEGEFFGHSLFQDSLHAQELGIKNFDFCDLLNPETTNRLVYQYLYHCGQKTFWVEGFTSDTLVIHVTRKKVLRPEALHCKK